MSEMERSTVDILEQLQQAGAFMPGTLGVQVGGTTTWSDSHL
jgi:hypothetical protein